MSKEAFSTYLANIRSAGDRLVRETGIIPGGDTGYCHRWLMAALTGVVIPDADTVGDQDRLEREYGFDRYMVIHPESVFVSDAVRTVIFQNHDIVEAVVLDGILFQSREHHIFAVVPAYDRSRFLIIDSQLPEGYAITADFEDVERWIQDYYVEPSLITWVVPGESLRRNRPLTGTVLSYPKEEIPLVHGINILAPKR